ncbi:MAG: histidine ammonia-lyase [Micrococcales bacterium]|nr:histidine ammonia-lyase [Micrococcales bacterium]NBR61750.1 histidine ammonia-lyase [Actinomycetota bacterium]NBT47903.1 histidine ammonia-lyase [Actinomycetota bacterium]NBY43263.1 histidine ammonia-lyase [Micrococcales bacterium]
MNTVIIKPSGTTFEDVLAVARGNAKVEISAESIQAMTETRNRVEEIAAHDEAVYGISTGFGALASSKIDLKDRVQLQKALIRSHAAGIGPIVEKEVVRALMTLRLKTLASGRTGARPVVAETMAAILNSGITPVVHEFGSLGCSGDLAPLAHCAMVMMGEGRAFGPDDVEAPVPTLLANAGITPVELVEKEGLALINGTDGMLGMLILAITDLEKLLDQSDLITAMSIEGLLGTDQVLRAELHEPLRPHPGQARSAQNMFTALQGSEIVASHRVGDGQVQDAYSLRCAPQVAGAVRDTIAYAKQVAHRELAATIDNPIVLENGEVTSNGNFHGAPVGYVLDFLAIAATDLSSISERRIDRMMDKHRNNGLSPFLAGDAGVDSGLMIAQYTAAGLVSDSKRLAVPASVDSIPSSAMQEDHVSMGWHAGRKLRKVVDNLRYVLAIELIGAARCIELRSPLKPATATAAMITKLRKVVPGVGPDTFMAPEIQAAAELLAESL